MRPELVQRGGAPSVWRMNAAPGRGPDSGGVVQGYLEKLHTGLFRSWQRRWFRVEGDKLM